MIIANKADLIGTYKSKKYSDLACDELKGILPIKSSPELTRIVGSLITDGFIDVRKRNNSTYYGYTGFFSKNICELKNYNSDLSKVFKVKGKIGDWGKRDSGVSFGNILIKSPISRLLTYYDKHGKRWTIRYAMHKKEGLEENNKQFLLEIIGLLNEFGIVNQKIHKEKQYTRKRDGVLVKGFGIFIRDKQDIKRFCDRIGFDIKKKQDKLRTAVNSEL